MPFRIVHNDIIKMETDAIVNTSNPLPIYAPGSDSAVYNAAGIDLLLAERKKIGPMERGQAAITPGFHLPAKYIIHTVGPAYIDGRHGEAEDLAACYRNSLHVARRKGLHSIAFPLISTGVYGYPKGEAMKIAISEINAFLIEHDMDVFLVVFDQESRRISDQLFADIDSYIDRHYVKEKLKEEYWLPEDNIIFEEFSEEFPNTVSSVFHSVKEKTSKPKPPAKPKQVKQRPAKPKPIGSDSMSLDALLSRSEETFNQMMFRFIQEKGMTNPEVYQKAGVSKKLFSKIKNDVDYHPSKKTVFALALGLELNIDQTRDFLLRAGYAINPSDKFDLVMQYFIERQFYNVIDIEIALYEHNLPLLHD